MKVPKFGQVVATVKVPSRKFNESGGKSELLVYDVIDTKAISEGCHRFDPVVHLSHGGFIGRLEDGRFFEVAQTSGIYKLCLLEPETEENVILRLANYIDDLRSGVRRKEELSITSDRIDKAERALRAAEDLHVNFGQDPIVSNIDEGARFWGGAEL